MILKDLMEEKQLNFNQPLLSVRRFSSTVANEADRRSKTDDSLTHYQSELKSVPVRNAGTVPFVWEKVPGKPKDETKLQTQSVTESRTGSSFSSNSQRVASLDKRVPKYSKDGNMEKESSYSDDGDESYKDAFDTLSRSESFFTSCSFSGLSGWEEQEAQSYGSFSSDHLQARDFMIGYVSKKELVGQEQQKQKKREVNVESDECNEYEKSNTTSCGLFPRFCILNPMPGLRMDKDQRNAAHRMHDKSGASHIGSTKGQVRTTCGFTEEKEILDVLVKSRHATHPHQRVCRKIVSYESTQHDYENHVREKTMYVDSVNKVTSQTNSRGGDKECSLDINRRFTKSGHQETSGASCFGLPLVLPSLKAPSESWLKRTLPTISKKNVTSRSSFIAKLHAQCHSPDNIIVP